MTVALLGLAVASVPVTAQGNTARENGSPDLVAAPGGRLAYTASRANGPIRVDGVLDEMDWMEAAVVPLMFEVSPGNNTPAAVATECRVTFDASNLYFGCRAADPEVDGVRAYYTDRDDIDGHDRIGITIDPFNDARRAFEFGVTPLGVQADRVIAETQQNDNGPDFSWDAIWASAGQVTDDGYVVEAAIPFRSLRFPGGAEPGAWGFYAWRVRPRSDVVELRSMYLDPDNTCALCQANLLEGISGASPGANLEFAPTLTGIRTDSLPTSGQRLVDGGIEQDVGLDMRWGVTSDLSLNATLNPDFSQVEADVAQLDVNNRFALFFPEKRPFFLEGADIFSTPIQATFTRTIADPSVGTKLTGKVGANAVGALIARDEATNLVFPGNQSSSSSQLDGSVTTAMARYRRDLGASSTVGVLMTGREGRDYHNRVAGADAFLRPWAPVTLRMQYLRSHTGYPSAVAAREGQPLDAFSGNAVRMVARYDTRRWLFRGMFSTLDRGFRADAGFVNQIDLRTYNLWGARRFWGNPGQWFTRFDINGGAWRNETLAGRLTEQGVWTNIYYEGPMQTSIWINPDRAQEFFRGETHTLYRLWSGWAIRPSGNFGVEFNFNTGDAIDFANGRKAFKLQFNPRVQLRLGRHFDMELSQQRQRLSTRGERIFTALLTEARGVYNFNTRTFVRVILQVRDTDRNPALYEATVNPETRAVFGQFLFSYKVNPQTVVFLGYTDDREGRTERRADPLQLNPRQRSFFVKLGYAWRP